MKRIVLVGIVILLLGICLFPAIASLSLIAKDDRNIITVDNEGDGDYTSIKEALNNSNPGDTIEVYSGTYYEHNITIGKEDITLKGIPYELGNGNDKGKPFINGEGKDIVIGISYANNITIIGFHIENGGGTYAHNIIGFYEADSCLISDNDLAYATCGGIYGKKSTNTRIVNNTIRHSGIREGIGFHEGYNNTICGNLISDIDFSGIYIWDDHYNTITGNKIMRCSRYGIDVSGSFIKIIRNHIENNDIGIYVKDSFNKIIGNHIENNDLGIQLRDFFNQVKRNNFINNNNPAQFGYGIPLLQRLTNIWFGNYWDKPRLLPYPIPGVLFLIPTIQFDWRPALKPHDIG